MSLSYSLAFSVPSKGISEVEIGLPGFRFLEDDMDMRLDDVVILDVFHDIEPLSFRILSAKAKALLFQSGVAGKYSIHVPHSDGDVDDGFGFNAGDGGASDRLERNGLSSRISLSLSMSRSPYRSHSSCDSQGRLVLFSGRCS